ncbi:MAG: macro domain-containing protein [Actinomycetes bacterium]
MPSTDAEAAVVDGDGLDLQVVVGDLTRETTDVIVNAANVHLRHGGGVAGALSRAGGPAVQAESNAWVATHGPLRDGRAAVTTAGTLAAGHLVHVAGPVYEADRDDNAERLALAVTTALDAAADLGATSVALPLLSAGIYGYPRAEAAAVLVRAVRRWGADHPDASLGVVRVVVLDEGAADDVRAAT